MAGSEGERSVRQFQPAFTGQSRFAASSASSLRSPFVRTMCAAIFSRLKRSATIVRPLDALSTYGLSIWCGSPVRTIFVPSPAARDDRLHLVRREVLRLVDDHVLVRERAAADVRERLDLDDARCRAARRSRAARALASLPLEKRNSRLSKMGCIHGLSFSSTSPGRKPMSRPSGMIGRDDEHARVHAVLDGALEARGEREQRLAGAGLADERDEPDARRRAAGRARRLCSLLRGRMPMHALARRRAAATICFFVGVVAAERGVRRRSRDRAAGRRGSREVDAPVARALAALGASGATERRPGRRRRSSSPETSSSVTPVLDPLRLDALVLVGLGDHAERVGADAEVRVHRDEDGRPAAVRVAHVERRLEDGVVHRGLVERGRQLGALARDGDA